MKKEESGLSFLFLITHNGTTGSVSRSSGTQDKCCVRHRACPWKSDAVINPPMDIQKRASLLSSWHKAVSRSHGWAENS